ncbi:hypothetical protein PROFUN_07259 [Planoprotostelium fungivorum]|uniref:Uncharacterized protein n=1 Tax=Planoprotostelium fungivorum TaxID=1890364 RepID=A0A2P6NM83_9EUKA|nr:hypothetical protein PROFUN_07259 [Planoprotostelium fungivorum]
MKPGVVSPEPRSGIHIPKRETSIPIPTTSITITSPSGTSPGSYQAQYGKSRSFLSSSPQGRLSFASFAPQIINTYREGQTNARGIQVDVPVPHNTSNTRSEGDGQALDDPKPADYNSEMDFWSANADAEDRKAAQEEAKRLSDLERWKSRLNLGIESSVELFESEFLSGWVEEFNEIDNILHHHPRVGDCILQGDRGEAFQSRSDAMHCFLDEQSSELGERCEGVRKNLPRRLKVLRRGLEDKRNLRLIISSPVISSPMNIRTSHTGSILSRSTLDGSTSSKPGNFIPNQRSKEIGSYFNTPQLLPDDLEKDINKESAAAESHAGTQTEQSEGSSDSEFYSADE